MCLAVPGQIIDIRSEQGTRMATITEPTNRPDSSQASRGMKIPSWQTWVRKLADRKRPRVVGSAHAICNRNISANCEPISLL